MAQMRLLTPLLRRDFALLTAGSAISLLGDGVFSVALAWQVYQISNTPTALSLVYIAWTLPLGIFLLLGGIVGDRVDRRRVMIAADLLRAAAVGLAGVLSVGQSLQLWHLLVVAPLYGIGDAFFIPAATAIVPDLVPDDDLAQANALRGGLRSLMLSLLGPALGGLVVAVSGPGTAFLIDAASFLASAATTAAITARRHRQPGREGVEATLQGVGEGLRFVRATPWCWATLCAVVLGVLASSGPRSVLLPYLVKNELHAGADGLGFMFAVGGVGAILAALVLGQVGLPRRPITALFCAWSGGVLATAGYGLMTALWQGVLVAGATGALYAAADVIWAALLQRLVPRDLLARVSSVDWLMTVSLAPLSFALTGPVAALFGARPVMTAAPLVAAVLAVTFLFAGGARDPEREPASPSGAACP